MDFASGVTNYYCPVKVSFYIKKGKSLNLPELVVLSCVSAGSFADLPETSRSIRQKDPLEQKLMSL